MQRSSPVSARRAGGSAAASPPNEARTSGCDATTIFDLSDPKDKASISLTPLQIPDDILGYICEALVGTSWDTAYSQTSVDKQLMKRTLLDLQTVSKAGWKAATPFIWKTLTFVKEDDYLSFFSPITALVATVPPSPATGRFKHMVDLLKSRANRPAPMDRFLSSLHWIRSVAITSAPPVEIGDELDFTSQVLLEVQGIELRAFGSGMRLVLGGGLCPPDGSAHASERLQLLQRFTNNLLPSVIGVFDIPSETPEDTDRFWDIIRELQEQYEYPPPPLAISDLRRGQLRYTANAHVFIDLSDRSFWSNPKSIIDDPDNHIANEIADFVAERMMNDDALFYESTLTIKKWLGCPCGCDVHEYAGLEKRTLVEEISEFVMERMDNSNYFGDLKSEKYDGSSQQSECGGHVVQ